MARQTDADTTDADDEQPTEHDVTLLYLTFDEDNPQSERARDIRCFGREDPDGEDLLTDDAVTTVYDERHETTVEVASDDAALAAVWAQWNRGSGRESRDFIAAQTRSLSAGDIAIVDGTPYFCAKLGWDRLEMDVDTLTGGDD